MAEAPSFKIKIPPEIQKFLSKDAAKEAKLLVAKGLVPMAPNILLTALFMLNVDSDPDVQQEANKSLLNQPPTMLRNLLAQPMHPKILDFYGRHKISDEVLLETILLNRYTPDETFAFLAPQVSERLFMIIAQNQERLLRTPNIGEALRGNANAPRAEIERMISFLRMNGIVLEGVDAELSKEEVLALINEKDDVLINILRQSTAESSPSLSGGAADGSANDEFGEDAESLAAILLSDDAMEGEEESAKDKNNVQKKVSSMTVAQKIKFALKGNKEVRSLLIKDPNKLVCTSVIKSPKIQEAEVINIASLRSVSEDVLRIIANNPNWTKNYSLKQALVNNPKTPLPISVQYLKHLREGDIQGVTKNKNVSQQLARIAKQLYMSKRK